MSKYGPSNKTRRNLRKQHRKKLLSEKEFDLSVRNLKEALDRLTLNFKRFGSNV